jgi:hypothetical protein
MTKTNLDENNQSKKRLELFDVLYNFRKRYSTSEIITHDNNCNIITIYLSAI